MTDKIKAIRDVTHWRQLVKSEWLRGADLDPNRDTILTVKEVRYVENPGAGIDQALTVFTWVEDGWKPYGTSTVACLKAIAKVYGSDNPNDWKPGQRLALYPETVKGFGGVGPAVRFRSTAPQFVTPEQVAELETLLASSGRDRAKLLQWAKVDKIEDIDAKTFSKVRQMLAQREAK